MHLGLTKKEHALIIVTRIIAIIKQVNFCDASKLMPHFAIIIFSTFIFQPTVKQIIGKKQIVVIKFMKFYAYIFGYTILNC